MRDQTKRKSQKSEISVVVVRRAASPLPATDIQVALAGTLSYM